MLVIYLSSHFHHVLHGNAMCCPFKLIYDIPSGKLLLHCECAPCLRKTKAQAHQNSGTSCVIHVISQLKESIDAAPHCQSLPTCCGRGLWGGGGRRHLPNNAISGFDHHVMMAHSGLNGCLLGGIN